MNNAFRRYRANPIVSCGDEGEDGAILFNPDTDDVALIDPTGRTIWQFIGIPRTTAQITAHLVETFRDVSSEQAANDVGQFIQALSPDFIQEVEAT